VITEEEIDFLVNALRQAITEVNRQV
jgi:hypothetical protein